MDENISKVYEEIKHLLSDEEILTVAEAREKQFLDYNSAINNATRRGHQEGIEQNKIENAKALLDLLDTETIAERIGLLLETVKKLRLENIKEY